MTTVFKAYESNGAEAARRLGAKAEMSRGQQVPNSFQQGSPVEMLAGGRQVHPQHQRLLSQHQSTPSPRQISPSLEHVQSQGPRQSMTDSSRGLPSPRKKEGNTGTADTSTVTKTTEGRNEFISRRESPDSSKEDGAEEAGRTEVVAKSGKSSKLDQIVKERISTLKSKRRRSLALSEVSSEVSCSRSDRSADSGRSTPTGNRVSSVSPSTRNAASGFRRTGSHEEMSSRVMDMKLADLLQLLPNARLGCKAGSGSQEGHVQLADSECLRRASDASDVQAELKDTELVLLTEANSRLEAEVKRLRQKQLQMDEEKRKLSSRLMASQTALQQLEREAAIRSRARFEFSSAAAAGQEDGKAGWIGWVAGQPEAASNAVRAVEEARMLRAQAASTIEKLIAENSDLTWQLNEQSILIGHLADAYNAAVGRSLGSSLSPREIVRAENLQQPLLPPGSNSTPILSSRAAIGPSAASSTATSGSAASRSHPAAGSTHPSAASLASRANPVHSGHQLLGAHAAPAYGGGSGSNQPSANRGGEGNSASYAPELQSADGQSDGGQCRRGGPGIPPLPTRPAAGSSSLPHRSDTTLASSQAVVGVDVAAASPSESHLASQVLPEPVGPQQLNNRTLPNQKGLNGAKNGIDVEGMSLSSAFEAWIQKEIECDMEQSESQLQSLVYTSSSNLFNVVARFVSGSDLVQASNGI